ncbi:hypothetical protein V8D89_002961 [Ganoderma adspersum]
MQFFALVACALSFAAGAVAAPGEYSANAFQTSAVQTVLVGYSLDLNPTTYLSSLSCSATFAQQFPLKSLYFSVQRDGALIFPPPPTGFHVLGDLPTAPFYGEVPGAVDGSQLCGSCWQLQYNNQPPVYMIAVDNASTFQLSKPAFDQFAGTQGGEQGSVTATAVQVASGLCGL